MTMKPSVDFIGLRDLLKAYIVLSEANNYYARMGRDPGQEPLDKEDQLYNMIRKIALST